MSSSCLFINFSQYYYNSPTFFPPWVKPFFHFFFNSPPLIHFCPISPKLAPCLCHVLPILPPLCPTYQLLPYLHHPFPVLPPSTRTAPSYAPFFGLCPASAKLFPVPSHYALFSHSPLSNPPFSRSHFAESCFL